MKYLSSLLTSILLVFGISFSSQGQTAPPNVLLILADDQGSIDLNCYGAHDLHTPNLDQLAQTGVRFTQFYAAAPVCSPSRAAVITGCYPQEADVPGNVSSQPGNPGMPNESVTIAEMMKSAGYATGHIGKWHLGFSEDTMPNAQGFDYSFGHMGGCIDNYSHFFYWNGPNRHDLYRNGKETWADGHYFGDLMVEEVCRFMDIHQKDPFFLYWAINMPHYPLQGKEEFRKLYEGMDEPRKSYAAFVSTMDDMIGRALKHLDDLGLSRNTLVIYMSDHGHSTEIRTFGGGGNAGPYRGAKFSLFEGGIRVPAMIRLPGRFPAGEVRGQLATAVDWLPTIADVTGATLPEGRNGASLLPIIKSDQAPDVHRVFHWQTGNRNNPQWAVRSGPWKLIGNPQDTSNKAPITEADKLFLSNLETDVTEMTNMAADHPEIVKRLKAEHDEWIASVKYP
jgi:arylsulfatase A-like enzyme